MIFIGIDPGLNGAVAVLTHDGLIVADTPTVSVARGNDYLVTEMAALLRCPGADVRCALEAGIAMPRQSVSSTAKQFRGVGLWEGMLAALGIPYELVAPRQWKHDVGLPVGAGKGESRVLASRLFPALADQFARAKDDGRAEAALLAEWSRRRG